MRQRKALNVLLTVNAALLGLLVLDRVSPLSQMIPEPQAAYAFNPQPKPSEDPAGGGMISAAEQRKQMISELQNLSRKIDRMDAALRGTLSVRVTEMPKSKDADKDK